MSDRSLTSGEQTAIILLGLFVTPLALLAIWFWWRDTSPLRAEGVWHIGKWFLVVYGVLLVLLLVPGLFGLFR